MRTTLDLDDDLMTRLLKQTGAKTKTAAVEEAIRQYLRKEALEALKNATGTIDLDYDWRKEEANELRHYRRLYGRRRR